MERCVIIVPYLGHVEPECERSLSELARLGFTVWREPGSAAIDRKRSQLATRALDQGFQALLWIDSDMLFEPTAVTALLAQPQALVGAICARRAQRAFNCVFEPETRELTLGEGGGLLRVQLLGTGFLLTRRSAFEAIERHFDLPRCAGSPADEPCVPYFLPLVSRRDDGSYVYLGEDYAFCERARRAGLEVYADTRLRIGHLGKYEYRFEDVAFERRKTETLRLKLNGTDKP